MSDIQKSDRVYLPILEKLSCARVVLLGDLVADRYVYAHPSRISREAPVMVTSYEHEEIVPGGAANTAHNLATLGVQTQVVGLVGDDKTGRAVLETLEKAGADVSGVRKVPGKNTITKTRVMVGESQRTKQQVIRIDRNTPIELAPDMAQDLIKDLDNLAAATDVWVASEYGYGLFTSDVMDFLCKQHPAHTVVADSRWRMGDFHHVSILTPNESEVEEFSGKTWKTKDELQKIAEDIRENLGLAALLVTRGKRGMLLVEETGKTSWIPPFGSEETVDVTGAGDTVAAILGAALAAGADFEEAAGLANIAAGLAVRKICAATLTVAEIKEALS